MTTGRAGRSRRRRRPARCRGRRPPRPPPIRILQLLLRPCGRSRRCRAPAAARPARLPPPLAAAPGSPAAALLVVVAAASPQGPPLLLLGIRLLVVLSAFAFGSRGACDHSRRRFQDVSRAAGCAHCDQLLGRGRMHRDRRGRSRPWSRPCRTRDRRELDHLGRAVADDVHAEHPAARRRRPRASSASAPAGPTACCSERPEAGRGRSRPARAPAPRPRSGRRSPASGWVKTAVGISAWSTGRGRPAKTVSAKACASGSRPASARARSVTSPTA